MSPIKLGKDQKMGSTKDNWMTEPRTERKKRYQQYASMAGGTSSASDDKLPSIGMIEALKQKMVKAASQRVKLDVSN